MLKKLAFAPIFLLIFTLAISQLIPITKSYDFIFSVSFNTLINLVIVSSLVSLFSLLFVLFATLADDWRIILPIGTISALIPMLFIEPALGLVFANGEVIKNSPSLLKMRHFAK
ncbi:hypothetical protein HYU93_02050 [Candidatus Daviesbacteria bacterium]|nr:hypothetical protein [Candidatus Daviesbacteria bacterium]